jgi:hypothetical protein
MLNNKNLHKHYKVRLKQKYLFSINHKRMYKAQKKDQKKYQKKDQKKDQKKY